MSALLPALLAGSAVAAAGALPRPSVLRLRALAPGPAYAPRSPLALHVLREPLPRTTADHRSATLLALLGTAAGVPVLGPAPALLLGVAAVVTPRLLAARRRSAAAEAERRSAAEACSALAAELRAGRSYGEALEVAAALARGPSGDALRAAAATVTWGGDVPAALLSGPTGSAVPEVLRGLAACWQVCSGTGSGLAAAVERLAEGVRGRQAQERAVAAALAGPRASAGLLALLPVAGLVLAAGLGARPLHVLLHTPLGAGCAVAGVGLDLLGLWWTRQLVRRAASA